jgi:hypothetical protein
VYFAAAGMRVQLGRDFDAKDRTRETHVTIINETLARLLFPGENPIGRRIGVGGGDAQGDWHEIIGVVADVRHQALDQGADPRVYDLFGQHWGRTLYVVVKSRTGAPGPLSNIMRGRIAALNPNVPVFEGATLQMLVDRSVAARRLATILAVALAGASLLLALVGVSAITAALAVERSREMGVRAALGASPGHLRRLIATESAQPSVWGGLAGIAGSIATFRLLAPQLFGVEWTDSLTLTSGIAIGVLGASLLAALPSGVRAAATDPLVAMRSE